MIPFIDCQTAHQLYAASAAALNNNLSPMQRQADRPTNSSMLPTDSLFIQRAKITRSTPLRPPLPGQPSTINSAQPAGNPSSHKVSRSHASD
jgi:hypothetical protein